jgi:ABC-type multidrug transport system fused ATPase/permease subunit
VRVLPVSEPGTPAIGSPSRFLLWLVGQQKGSVALGALWGCTWMVAQSIVPAVIGAAVDALIGRQTHEFAADCAFVLVLGVITAASGVLRHRCVIGNFLDAAYRTIQLVTNQVCRLGETMARLVSTGEIVSVAAGDVADIGMAIDVSGRGSGAIAALISTALIMLSRSVLLGLIVLIGAPAMTALVGLLLRPLHERQQVYREQQGELSARAADIVTGLRVLRGIGGEDVFSARYQAESQQLRRTGVRVAGTESYLLAAEVLLPGMFVTAATWLAAHYALHGSIKAGQLVTFYLFAAFLALPLATLTEAADKIVRGYVAAGRVTRILALQPDVAEPSSPRPEPPYGATLHDPESGLTAQPGEFLGVAAESADQAVALADRLGRYGTGTGRAPELGGVPLADLPVSVVRGRILVAAADAQLFGGPVRAAVGAGSDGTGRERAGSGKAGSGRAVIGRTGSDRSSDDGAGDDEAAGDTAILAALEVAGATDVLDAIPGGISGRLSASGSSLSGGQAQRLRLARALLADSEILVLVEPTSAVDAHTEATIASRLRAHRDGRTTIVLTTSPLLLDAADRVVFVRDGRVIADGTHRELLSVRADYADVVTRGEDQ